MRWHVGLAALGAVLLVAAVTVMSLQVRVGGPGQSGRSCGSSLDVITDRSGWEVWYAQDTLDAPQDTSVPLLRTIRCPAAVNTRTVAAGVLAGVGIAALVVAVSLGRRLRSPAPATGESAVRLRRLGAVATAVAATLVVAGLCALGVLLANGDAALFVFVRRPVVAVIGIVLLAPLLALLAGGWALTVLARSLDDRERRDEIA